MDTYNICVCPHYIRPYKAKNSVWTLEKAIQYIFHQTFDKPFTTNIWSCRLDPHLNTWYSHQDKATHAASVIYALNDTFA